VENVEVIQVTLADQQPYVGRLISHDPVTDLAVIKIDAEQPLDVIDTGISTDLMPGEPVIAVGNAFGYQHTVTRGIISALHREVQVSAAQKYRDLIQTDASINPGNSGGPLLNIDGEMIGINVAVRVGAQGIGFAIPIDETLEIAARLLSVERLENRVHGVTGETRTDVSGRSFVVKKLAEGTAAARCGLQVGDVVTRVDDRSIHRALDFERALLGKTGGRPVQLTVQRGGDLHVLRMVFSTDSSPPDDFQQRTWTMLGMRLAAASPEECRKHDSHYRGGMRVTAIRADGPASRQGIRKDDILVGMHVWETVSKDNVRYILNHEQLDTFQPIKFYVLRNGETLYGHLEMDRPDVWQISRRADRD
jgi:serine protease Do